jgi:thioredoxin 1
MSSDKIRTITDGNFSSDVLSAGPPVLVDFWAPWCGPCRRIAPIVEALASELDGRLVVGKMNIDENPETPIRYAVRGIPTLLLFKGGDVVESVVGLTGKEELKRILEPHLPAAILGHGQRSA